MKSTTIARHFSFLLLASFIYAAVAAQTFGHTRIDGTFHMIGNGTGNQNYDFRINNLTTDGGRFFVGVNGNVGIGTNSPTSKLQIKIGNVFLENGELFVNSSSPIGGSMVALRNFVSNTGTYYGQLTTMTTNQLVLGADDNKTMYFSLNDKVGIGTSNPLEKLHVSNGAAVLENNGIQTYIGTLGTPIAGNMTYHSWVGTITSSPFAIGTFGKKTMVFTTDENVGIGISAPTSKLHVNGNIRVESNFSMAPATFQIDEPGIFGGRFSVTSAGNVGIGIAAPTSKLHVNGNTRLESSFSMAPATFQIDAPGIYGGRFSVTSVGNVGIGIAAPMAKLHVKDGPILMEKGAIKVIMNDDPAAITGWMGTASNHPLTLVTNNSAAMSITTGGSVGIGTITPEAKLHVMGGAILMERNTVKVAINDNSSANAGWIGTTTNHPLYLAANNTGRMRIETNGNIFMGFDDATFPAIAQNVADNYDLFVHKGVLSEDFALAPVADWADYVFDNNYTLKPLSEVEKFINANKHLPGIPSAEDVKKDGYSVKDINVKFLEKIEELTLYTIEQEKKIKELEKQAQQYEQLAAEVQKLKEALRTK